MTSFALPTPDGKTLDPPAIFDLPRLRRNLAGDDQLIDQVAIVFSEDVVLYVRALCVAQATDDCRALRDSAHALKGAARSFTADRVASLAGQIEQAADERLLAGMAGRIADLQLELAVLEATLVRLGLRRGEE